MFPSWIGPLFHDRPLWPSICTKAPQTHKYVETKVAPTCKPIDNLISELVNQTPVARLWSSNRAIVCFNKVRPYLFGAKLHALRKKDGGLRPIAVGLTLRRLAAKVANRWATECSIPILFPRQLGGGGFREVQNVLYMPLEPTWITSLPFSPWLNLDYLNTFNSGICLGKFLTSFHMSFQHTTFW